MWLTSRGDRHDDSAQAGTRLNPRLWTNRARGARRVIKPSANNESANPICTAELNSVQTKSACHRQNLPTHQRCRRQAAAPGEAGSLGYGNRDESGAGRGSLWPPAAQAVILTPA